MSNKLQRGEIATVLTIGAVIFLGAATLISTVFLKSQKQFQTTTTKATDIDSGYHGSCVAPYPPISQDTKYTPTGYRWKADCSKSCNANSDCPKSTDISAVNPETSNWCYGFSDGMKCMMLEKIPGAPIYTCPDGGIPKGNGDCEYGWDALKSEFYVEQGSPKCGSCILVLYSDGFPYGSCRYSNPDVCRPNDSQGGCRGVCNRNCCGNNSVTKTGDEYEKLNPAGKSGLPPGGANPTIPGGGGGAQPTQPQPTQPGQPANPTPTSIAASPTKPVPTPTTPIPTITPGGPTLTPTITPTVTATPTATPTSAPGATNTPIPTLTSSPTPTPLTSLPDFDDVVRKKGEVHFTAPLDNNKYFIYFEHEAGMINILNDFRELISGLAGSTDVKIHKDDYCTGWYSTWNKCESDFEGPSFDSNGLHYVLNNITRYQKDNGLKAIRYTVKARLFTEDINSQFSQQVQFGLFDNVINVTSNAKIDLAKLIKVVKLKFVKQQGFVYSPILLTYFDPTIKGYQILGNQYIDDPYREFGLLLPDDKTEINIIYQTSHILNKQISIKFQYSCGLSKVGANYTAIIKNEEVNIPINDNTEINVSPIELTCQ